MEILGYLFAVFIGLIMGVIGGGGSILSVPVFAYLFKFDAITATALSLFVVGITSFVGSIEQIKHKRIDFNTAILFGIPSIIGVLFSRRLVLPNLPQYIINKWGILITKEMFILVLFAVLMLISAYKMINKINKEDLIPAKETNYTLLVSQGLLVGIVTGFVGAGGGFLIVPALVMLLNMDIKKAISTSFIIISMNSLIGFISSLDTLDINWKFILTFTLLSVIGLFIGIRVSKNIDGKKLKPLFGWLVLIMGIWIIVNELLFKQFI